jgi:bacterial/archaeal transporter family protein
MISAVAAGATSVFAKAGLSEVPAQVGNAIRTAMVLGLTLAVVWWTGEHREVRTLGARTWMFLGLSGVATAVSWAAFFQALARGPATPVTAIDKASLVVTMLLGAWFFGEHLTWRGGAGIALVVIGAWLAASAD